MAGTTPRRLSKIDKTLWYADSKLVFTLAHKKLPKDPQQKFAAVDFFAIGSSVFCQPPFRICVGLF